jgi:hypothetical protein
MKQRQWYVLSQMAPSQDFLCTSPHRRTSERQKTCNIEGLEHGWPLVLSTIATTIFWVVYADGGDYRVTGVALRVDNLLLSHVPLRVEPRTRSFRSRCLRAQTCHRSQSSSLVLAAMAKMYVLQPHSQ